MGVDISDEMIRRAREKSRAFANVTYHCGQAEQIPKVSGYFTKIMSIEAFYYFERQDEVLLGRDDAEGNIATKIGRQSTIAERHAARLISLSVPEIHQIGHG